MANILARARRIHWSAPTIIASSFLAALLFALGHHAYNDRLDGTPVESGSYSIAGNDVSKQQVNFAVGFTLARLFTACLTMALSTSYIQLFWHTASGRRNSIGKLDGISGVVSNAIYLLNLPLWRFYPLLLLLALVIWRVSRQSDSKRTGSRADIAPHRLTPIASIIPPATLSVVSASFKSSALMDDSRVPVHDFKSLKYIHTGSWTTESATPGNGLGVMTYNGAASTVERIVRATATRGEILPIAPPGVNSSWTANFAGPYLRCNDLEGARKTNILKNILTGYYGDLCKSPPNYLAWTLSSRDEETPYSYDTRPADYRRDMTNDSSDVVFYQNVSFGSSQLIANPWPIDFADLTTKSVPASLYLTAWPGDLIRTVPEECTPRNDWPPIKNPLDFGGRPTVLECQLVNASYTSHFTYTNGAQSVETTNSDIDSAAHLETLPYLWMDFSLVGVNGSTGGDLPCLTANIDKSACVVNETVLAHFAYQAIMDVFAKVFVGLGSGGEAGYHGGNTAVVLGQAINTSIFSTVLADTRELSFLNLPYEWSHYFNASNVTGLFSTPQKTELPSLADAVEELFRNVTISMLSSSMLTQDANSWFPSAGTNVTKDHYHNVYAYAALKLWMTYGIALAAALACVLLGLVMIWINGASFSNSFSSVLRAARAAELIDCPAELDGYPDASDPLPKGLANAKISLPKARQERVEEMVRGDDKVYSRVNERAVSETSSFQPRAGE